MNWITKFIKPKIKSLFEKKSSKSEENLWTTCECKNLIYKEDLQANFKCCPKCGSHHKLSSVNIVDKSLSLIDLSLFIINGSKPVGVIQTLSILSKDLCDIGSNSLILSN